MPRFDSCMRENPLYRTVLTYLNSLLSVEDSEYANLFSSGTKNEIIVAVDDNQTVTDEFLGARLYWTNEIKSEYPTSLVLKIRKRDKRRILRPYLQKINSAYDLIEQSRREVRLYLNAETDVGKNGRWRSVEFTHPATMDTMVMDVDLKNKIKSDLEFFVKSKQYYNRMGRVWKRSYLLYGPSGTGKSSFIASMAKFLSYDIYDIDLSRVDSDTDLKMLLMQTTSRSVIVVEDLDRYVSERPRSTAGVSLSLSGVLNFMDGIVSCCGKERVMVFTVNSKDQIDPTVLRPGRVDVHVKFDLCDFSAFKSLVNNYLGVREHKLFPQVEEFIQSGSSMSAAEISELLLANRSSPTRALKSVISALQNNMDIKLSAHIGHKLGDRLSGQITDEVVDSGSFNTMKELRKLYGLLRVKSSRRSSIDYDSIDKLDYNNSQDQSFCK